MTKNHLANETSPYLLQHADNPVDWYPWGEEALAKARREQKPILLSIGYSACHWCHVMAHESFSDAETAKIMNQFFVNIKVDREERPDLDRIYQTTHQLLTQRAGGWPLTVFLTPDKQIPFFSGTYFPVEPRYQMPAFKEVLLYLAKFYQENKNAIEEQNQALLATLDNLTPKIAGKSITLNLAPFEMAIKAIGSSYDRINGGFGDAPKFPHPIYLELLLQAWMTSEKKDAAIFSMIEKTLTKMAEGGLYDQLGGGFYRYSVDAEWHIPHFEKMLYDNAQLLSLYAQAYAATNNPLFAQIARETGEWVIREMQSPEGGYYSTLDADSEGEEGKFYLWDIAEIKNILTPEEYQAIENYYGLANSPNFEHKWHLQISQPAAKVAKKHLESAKQKLMQTRDCRTYPHRDEKILSTWNGLMIKAMMEAGKFLKNPVFINSAQAAIDFIRTKLWVNNRLFATYKDDRARYPGYLDDYVFLLAGTLTALEIQWRDEDFYFAIQLAEVILQHFKDDLGGFFFTADDQETLMHRPKSFMDEAIPSSNGVAAFLFNRLWHLTGDLRYRTAAEATLKLAWQSIEHYPEAHGSLLLALAEVLTPPEIIIIRGKGKHIQEWQQVASDIYAPHRLVFAIPENAKHLPVNLAEKKLLANVVAYICRGEQCLPPITNINEFTDVIKNAQ